ncbi:MAG: AIM24 family protein [Pseudanabaena sp. CAN_BIN31]|nr:AIM24 family protein [Pseudanabaena sp. CAN_BIN31]
MKLISAIILWLANKISSILFLVAVLTVLFWARDTLEPQALNFWNEVSGKNSLEVVNRLNKEIDELKDIKIPNLKKELDNAKKNIDLGLKNECEADTPWYELYRFDKQLTKESACKTLETQYKVYFETRIKYLELNKELGKKFAQLNNVDNFGGVWNLLEINLQKNWVQIFSIILFVLLASPLWKVLCFFGFARLAEKSPPIQLTEPTASGDILYKNAEKTIAVKVDSSNPLSVRMDYMNQYDRNLTRRTRLFWKWSAPFISYASGLVELTEFTIKSEDEDGTVVLSPKVEDNYITAIQLQQHSGFVIHPAYIVGISGNIQLRTQWVWSLHSWLIGQHRYIIFYGTGKLYLEGKGGIYVMETSPAKTSLESQLLVGFDSQLAYSTIRTETFWPYFRNKISLTDSQFSGKGVFLRQAIAPIKKLTPLERNFQFIGNLTSIVGKFFGF